MAKLTGIVFVAAAAIYYAFYGLFVLKQRLDAVKELAAAAVNLRSAVGCTQKTVREVFYEMSKTEKTGVFKLFLNGMGEKKNGSELWRECIETTVLEKAERDVFLPLGDCLFSADREHSIKILDLTVESAKRCETVLLDKIEKYRSAEMKIRLMCGLMAVILLI
ncbi:MAG: stage III sporulation protein AB [Firmicutes bacterium]|nr:stage III sporulation protein AB [Bacillota bacterium]